MDPRRPSPPRTRLTRHATDLCLIFLLGCFSGWADEDPLKVLISVEQPSIAVPFPARATLHFHNFGKETLWLYRRVRSQAKEGASLEVRLTPLDIPGVDVIITPGEGAALESAGLPRPKLFPLLPGEDSTEKITLKLIPAKVGEGAGTPIWGRYRLSVMYSAQYSNSAVMARETGAVLWQGEATSAPIEIELQPPAGEGVVSGTVQGAQSRNLPDVIVTLSGEDERPIDQMVTEGDGRFAFGQLPPGKYWVTGRRSGFSQDTAVFRHVILTAAEPAGTVELQLLPPDHYEAQKFLHKPVLFLVTDGQENALGNVNYEIVWSSGRVIETLKGATDNAGRASVELIPGRHFVTLRRKGCKKQEHRMDVEAEGAVDGFKLAMECREK